MYGIMLDLVVYAGGEGVKINRLLKIEGREPSACIQTYLNDYWESRRKIEYEIDEWIEVDEEDFNVLEDYVVTRVISESMVDEQVKDNL